MKVLLIGGGGREHALAQALSRSSRLSQLLVTPGNPGIAEIARTVECEQTPQALADLARREQVALTVVGPEAPLAAGIADEFASRGLRLFGPSQAAARIEGDKAWSKAFMARHGIPTANYQSFDQLGEALAYAREVPLPTVIKDAGLRAGKGVTICASREEAERALRDIFSQPAAKVVVEDFMAGQEVTVLAFSDGEVAVQLPPSQDHKTIFEGDSGPMTGGMGVICPYPLTDEQKAHIQTRILVPALAGLRAEGCPFVGVLYAGLMLTARGPQVVEFNCRLGDPEAEAVLPLLQSDVLDVLEACVEGRLTPDLARFGEAASAVVVLAAPGYPGEPQKGVPLKLPQTPENVRIFHAGTSLQDGQLVSAGGRVLAVQATADTLEDALWRAYATVREISFPGAQYRRDIGFRLGVRPASRGV